MAHESARAARGRTLATALTLLCSAAWLVPDALGERAPPPEPAERAGGHSAGHSGGRSDRPAVLVAVLPFAASNARMTMYGKPIADAVARALAPEVADAAVEVQAISLSASVPKRVRLVIDGRIVAAGKGKLILEAQLRDPERGIRLARVSGAPGSLTDVDKLARALGARMTDKVVTAATRIRARARRASALLSDSPAGRASGPTGDGRAGGQATNGTGDADPGGTAHGAGLDTAVNGHRPSRESAPSGLAERPALVVFTPTGRAAGGSIEVVDIATEAARAVALQLGYRPVRSELSGIVSSKEAAPAMAEHGAKRALMLDIRDIDFTWRGVLTARGHFRGVLIDQTGKVLASVSRRTDTLVGSRGDRHRAVVRFVAAQITDILRAEFVKHAHRPDAAQGGANAEK